MDTLNGQVSGRIVEQTGEPQLYRVGVPSGEVRRNRVQLRTRGDSQAGDPHASEDLQVNATPLTQTIITQSRIGTSANPVAYSTRGSGCLSTPLAPILHYQTYLLQFPE